jgi:hypothetical protein
LDACHIPTPNIVERVLGSPAEGQAFDPEGSASGDTGCHFRSTISTAKATVFAVPDGRRLFESAPGSSIGTDGNYEARWAPGANPVLTVLADRSYVQLLVDDGQSFDAGAIAAELAESLASD